MKRLLAIALLVWVVLAFMGCASRAPLVKNQTGKSYTVLGKTYYPLKTVNLGHFQDGIASWYGPGFHGKKTATGEVYDMHILTAAHNTLPLHSVVKVTNLENKKDVVVRINDRGPFVDDRVIDLSFASAKALGMVGPGTVPVRLTVLTSGDTMFASKKKGPTSGKPEPEKTQQAKAPNPFFSGGVFRLLALTRN
jgi:rare lipoprotein A